MSTLCLPTQDMGAETVSLTPYSSRSLSPLLVVSSGHINNSHLSTEVSRSFSERERENTGFGGCLGEMYDTFNLPKFISFTQSVVKGLTKLYILDALKSTAINYYLEPKQ